MHSNRTKHAQRHKRLKSSYFRAENLASGEQTWELCSVRREREAAAIHKSGGSSNSSSIARDFSANSSSCNGYLNDFVRETCTNGQCSSQPILMCTMEYQPNSTVAKFLDDRVCTQRANICEGVADSLRANDNGSFNALGSTAAVQIMIWFFAITAVIGNFAVICRCLWVLTKRFRSLVKTEKVHHLLVLNLALSDFLMGFYVSMYGLAHVHHQETYTDKDRYEWLASATCSIMGVLSSCSSQMSVTMLVIITSFRLACVIQPFADQHKLYRRAMRITLFGWVFWITYALIPLLPFEKVRNSFYYYVKIDPRSCFKHADMHHDHLTEVMTNISQFISRTCGEEAAVRYSLPDEPSWNDLLKFGRDLKILSTNDEPVYFGYYNEQSVCSAKYFITNDSRSMLYTLTVVLYNCISFVYITIAYGIMWKRTSSATSPLGCCGTTRSRERKYSEGSDQRDRENRKMQWQIIVIIVTDFMCWVPICALSVYHFIKTSTYEEHGCEFHRYSSKWRARISMLTIVMLPINSSINPFIYSFRHCNAAKGQVVRHLKGTRHMGSATTSV